MAKNHARHEAFLESTLPHILMITNHGIHEWDVVPGLPDTGGQNVFVNQFSETLAELGYRITIANRGGFPHPISGDTRQGIHYKDERQRILYLQDDRNEFVRKEDMVEQTPQLADFLASVLEKEGISPDLIISHYWDGAHVGVLYNESRAEPVPHIWVPHSLGTVKKQNVNPQRYAELRIDERIEIEHRIVRSVDRVAATSSRIRRALREDYGRHDNLYLPPCVRVDRYHPQEIAADHPIWNFLSDFSALTPAQIRACRIVTEISRTDTTKRKDILLQAFSQVHAQDPDTFLVVSIDDRSQPLAAELKQLIADLGIADHVAAVGYVWDELPALYNVTDVYCSPSVMEGFGMSVQEAAATAVPVVTSDLVPFVTEYLVGEDAQQLNGSSCCTLGEGAIVVAADDTGGFAHALRHLLSHDDLRRKMGQKAYDITIPYFTWKDMTRRFLREIENLPVPIRMEE